MTKTQRERLVAMVLLSALSVTSAPLAFAADPATEARERYDSAVKLFSDGDYPAALVELRRAGELRPSYKLWYNIAQVHVAMHDYAAASTAYRTYLEQGEGKVAPERRDQVNAEILALARRVAKVSVATDVAGARVFLDDVHVGTTPLALPLLVNAGIRRIAVSHPDYMPQSRRFMIAGGTSEKVDFSLLTQTPEPEASGRADRERGAALESAPARPASTDPGSAFRLATEEMDAGESSAGREQPRADSYQTYRWIGWTATGGLAAGAIVTGLFGLDWNADLADARDDPNVSNAELKSRAGTVRTLAVVTDTLWVAAAAAGAVSLWLTLRDDSSDEATTPLAARAPSLELGFHPRGLDLRGSF